MYEIGFLIKYVYAFLFFMMLLRKVHAKVKLKNLVNFTYAISLNYLHLILHAEFE